MSRIGSITIICLVAVIVCGVGIYFGVANSNLFKAESLDFDEFGNATKTISFESLNLKPGDSTQCLVKLHGEPGMTYNCRFHFVLKGEKDLANYVAVTILVGDEVAFSQDYTKGETLATLFDKGEFALDKPIGQDLTIVYSMHIDVGNEAKNAKTSFDVTISAGNSD